MKTAGMNGDMNVLREFVRKGAEALVLQAAHGMEDEIVSDQDLERYGNQLQSLLAQTEKRLRESADCKGMPDNQSASGTGVPDLRSEGETARGQDHRSSSDMTRREETRVPMTNPENGNLSDIPGQEAVDASGRNPEKETSGDTARHDGADTAEKHRENGTSGDIVCRDSSAEAIEQYVQETSPEPVDPTDPTTQIHRRQLLAISGLLCGSTITATANQIGVNRRTVHRWMHDPKFQAAYRHCEAELRMAAQAQVAGLAEKAVRCVSESLDRGNARVGLELLKQLRVFSTRSTPDRIAQAETRTAALLLEVEKETEGSVEG